MKIGITGATGFMGRHLIDRLLKDGYSVKVLVIEKEPKLPKRVDFVRGDLVTGAGIPKFLDGVDVLIHLAGRNLPPEEAMVPDNVIATHNLIQEALKHPIKQIIFTSSVAVYGKDKRTKFKETDEPVPNTEYGLTKYLAEKIILYWSSVTGNSATIFRPFNVYGPGNNKGIIFHFYSDIKKTGGVLVYGDGKQERDYLYIDDIIEAFAKALKTKKSGIFNLGSPKKYSVLDVASTFKKIMDKDLQITFNPKEQGKVFNINQDLSLAKRELKWEAKTSFENGLKKTVEWYEKS